MTEICESSSGRSASRPDWKHGNPLGYLMLLYVYRFYLTATDIYVDALCADEEEVGGG